MYKRMTLYIILCIGAFVRFVRKSLSMLDFDPWDNILITGPPAAGVEAYVYNPSMHTMGVSTTDWREGDNLHCAILHHVRSSPPQNSS